MDTTRIVVWSLVVAAVAAVALSKRSQPPRTAAEAAQEEREIIAGTRKPRPPSRAQVEIERRETAAPPAPRPAADPRAALFEHCHAAVRRRFALTRTVVVDDGLVPASGHMYMHVYRGKRRVGISERPPDQSYYVPLQLPVSGSYVVEGTVRTGVGSNERTQFYDCEIRTTPVLFVTSVDFRPVK